MSRNGDDARTVHQADIPLRWADFDRYGHLLNSRYLDLAQEARDGWAAAEFRAHGLDVPAFVVRRVEVDFRKPVLPDPRGVVTVRTQVADVGRSSLTVRQELLDAEGRVAAVVGTVCVAVDLRTASSRAITSREREAIEAAAGRGGHPGREGDRPDGR